MDRRAYLATLGAVGAGGLAGCLGGDGGGSETPTEGTATSGPGTVAGECGSTARVENGSFECGTYGWTVGRDLPADPNGEGPVASNVAVTGFGREDPPETVPAAADGDHALELSIDGRQDDGTLWVQQPVDLTACETLSVAVHSAEESFNTITKLAAYAGPDRDLAEADFDTTRAVEDHAGWRSYEYPIDHAGEGLVAVGISVVWETELRRYLDDVRVV